MNDAVCDPYLALPLDGVRLIEASAGTGKTFTLATLVTRLVVERGLRIGQILAVTYTEAATQELRKRIRERLHLTLRLLDAPAPDGESSEAALTRQLLDAHRARGDESREALRRRLHQATLETDLAAIFTIHGFCTRVLREHALESGQGFDATQLLTNDRDLRLELAADLWRSLAQEADAADDLAALWSGGIDRLADDLPALLREPVLAPALAGARADPGIDAAQQRVAHAHSVLQQAWHAEGEAFLDALAAAIDAGMFNANMYKRGWLDDLRRWLQRFARDPGQVAEPHAKLVKLTAAALAAGAKKGTADRVPASRSLDHAVTSYLQALEERDGALGHRRAVLLHRLRDEARARMALRKRQRGLRTYDDLIDGVAHALGADRAGALAGRLRAQYAVALVDEFQDTDARQWSIFQRVFGDAGDAPALFVIGDPKQAIYGFRGGDVHAYLAAAAVAERAPPLSRNFRSRPGVLRAIATMYANAQALFDAGASPEPPFVDPDIVFRAVEPGGERADTDYQRHGAPAAPLVLWRASDPGETDAKGAPKPWRADAARALATRACVAAIHGVLADARAGRALIDGAPVQPGDIAVLVRSHQEATRVQQALAVAGIPAVAAGKQSLFATGEARDLHALLLALLHGGDDGRLRAALCTVLVGVDAAGIDRLDADPHAHRDWQQRAAAWRERLLRGGPLALVGELAAANAARLLGLLDGERRMSNYLQLAEALQEAQAGAPGLHGLVDWLAHRIATADKDDETQLLRLESDAHRVQIVTLHKSKGLEYPLVFLPFVGIGRDEKPPGRCCVVHDQAGGRRLQWKLDLAGGEWDAASLAWKRERRAEDARLLYVGLTRAQHALWIASGNFFAHGKTALAPMLGDLEALRAAGAMIDTGAPPQDLPRLPAESDAPIPPARSATRGLSHDWWVHSFSQLAKADAGADTASAATLPASGGHDEPQAPEAVPSDDGVDPRFAGNRYGVALHAALEHADFAAWRDWRLGEAAPCDQARAIAAALAAHGYAAGLLDEGIALTTQLVGRSLTAALPEGLRLCELPAGERRAELEFQFALQPVQVDALLRLLHAHGIVRERHGFGLRQRLEGLMTGLIDLTYRHAGKWYVLDYKSNRLASYDAAGMARAMAHHEYDLQALIYTLALHRWLRFRLGDAYDYARDFGGVRYLFCRGLGGGRDDASGIHAQRFAPELVDALDALFGWGDARGAAA